MIRSLSVRYSEYLSANKIIPKEKISIYSYGLELLISSVIGVVILFLISMFFGMPVACFAYLLGFIPLRILSGGYHAKTHLGCIISFSSVFCCAIILEKYLVRIPFISVLVLLINVLLSPVEAKNKPLSPKLRMKNRSKSNVLCFVFFLLSTISPENNSIINMFYLGTLISSLSLILALFTDSGCSSFLTPRK